MKPLHLTACDFTVYKDNKNQPLKPFFPISRINFRIQHLTCSLINYLVAIHHNIFLKSLSCEFLIVSSISFWSYIFWSIICYFRSSSRHAIQVGVSEPKIISLYFVVVTLMASGSSSFVFIQFRRGIFNFSASSYSDVLFIYY